jgi:hypothetical protein
VKLIELTVDPQGNTQVRTRGFAGPESREASRSLEQALGRAVSERPTAESHRSDQARVKPQ